MTLAGLVTLNQFDVDLCAVSDTPRKVFVGIDSGAGVSVWTKDLGPDYPTKETRASRDGVCYPTAGSAEQAIRNEGQPGEIILHTNSEARKMRDGGLGDVRGGP